MADIIDDLGKQANQRGLAGHVEIRARDEIVKLRDLLRAIRDRDADHNLFNIPSGGFIRKTMSELLPD